MLLGEASVPQSDIPTQIKPPTLLVESESQTIDIEFLGPDSTTTEIKSAKRNKAIWVEIFTVEFGSTLNI
ncbi:MAG: hypothetical protein ACI9JR_002450 [Gammaproteobacteria bacterium]|jgi:hypothetical protein